MPATVENLTIYRGETFTKVCQSAVEPFLTAAIASITRAVSVRITTAADHGIVSGWPVAVVGAMGITALNAVNNPPVHGDDADFRRATVISSTVVEFNGLSTALEKKAHTAATGYLVWYTPRDLSGFTARMKIKAKKTDTAALLELTSADDEIVIDNTAKTITVLIDADTTAALTWAKGFYDLEIESGDGEVTRIFEGTVTVINEVTTT